MVVCKLMSKIFENNSSKITKFPCPPLIFLSILSKVYSMMLCFNDIRELTLSILPKFLEHKIALNIDVLICLRICVFLLQKCQPGYYKDGSSPFLGLCVACECNGLSDECEDRTGRCLVRNTLNSYLLVRRKQQTWTTKNDYFSPADSIVMHRLVRVQTLSLSGHIFWHTFIAQPCLLSVVAVFV